MQVGKSYHFLFSKSYLLDDFQRIMEFDLDDVLLRDRQKEKESLTSWTNLGLRVISIDIIFIFALWTNLSCTNLWYAFKKGYSWVNIVYRYTCYGEALYDSHHACTFIHKSWWDSLGNGKSAFICSLQHNSMAQKRNGWCSRTSRK